MPLTPGEREPEDPAGGGRLDPDPVTIRQIHHGLVDNGFHGRPLLVVHAQALNPREHQQLLNDPLQALDTGFGLAQGLVGFRCLALRNLQVGFNRSQWCTQLVRCLAGEVLLPLYRIVHPCQQIVQR